MNHFILAEPSKCIGCNTCMAACALVHQTQGLLDRPRLQVMRDGDHTAPVLCRHCEDMPCATVCPVGAITNEANSVRINESLCVGCKLCGLACPFGAITPAASGPDGYPASFDYYVPEAALANVPVSNVSIPPFLSWNAGQRMVAVKCDLCHFQEGPACVRACPTEALKLIDGRGMEHLQKSKRLATLNEVTEINDAASDAKSTSGVHHA